jgi:Uma2 family endonuclease
MAIVIEPASSRADERFVLYDVPWKLYELILEGLGDSPTRATYDGRNLELMSPSQIHETYKSLFGRLMEALTFELHIPIRTGGSRTFRRSDVRRGLEPDECYWIQNEKAVRGKREISLEVDPPPDLFIEIDISSRSLDRMEICARLEIPEVWRFDGEALRIHVLGPDGLYLESPTSGCLPFLPVQELLPFLELDSEFDETTRIHQFVDWVRQRFSRGRP